MVLVRPTEFESATFGVGVQRSIQLSYGRMVRFVLKKQPPGNQGVADWWR